MRILASFSKKETQLEDAFLKNAGDLLTVDRNEDFWDRLVKLNQRLIAGRSFCLKTAAVTISKYWGKADLRTDHQSCH